MQVYAVAGYARSTTFGNVKPLSDFRGNMASTSLPKTRALTDQDFEVIGLSDSGTIRPPPGAAFRSTSQTGRSFLTSNTATRPATESSPSTSGRDLIGSKPSRPSLPALHSSPATTANSLQIPIRTSRRKKESRSPARLKDPTARHSTPSPPSPRSVSLNFTSSTSDLTAISSRPSTAKHPKVPPRRQSWQPGRKTIQQIEKEWDDDLDDDIPEDTFFWNIPLSPRAGKLLPLPSGSPSPERLAQSPLSRRNSGVLATLKADGRIDSPLASQSTMSLPNLAESNELIERRGRLQAGGKSWGEVMLDLGDDAKDLTEALERYADETIEAQEKRLQKRVAESKLQSQTPPTVSKQSVEINLRSDTPPRPLPQKQMSDSIVESLPISKEKEAVLSRTRPAWLPPKAKHEDEKHLKEYQEMIRLSIESDRKRAEKEKLEAANRERQRDSVYKVWDEKIIPNWNQAVLETSTRELWWAGISPKSRGVVWKRAFGNALQINDETYRKALERARSIEEEVNTTKERSPEKDWFQAIKRDAEITLPESKSFQSGLPMHQSLIDVLSAYSVYRKDIGYMFGLNLIAAHLLLNMSDVEAFQMLANILNRALPLSFYLQDEPGMTKIYNVFLRAFQYKLPRLHHHIHVKLQLPPPLYLESMFTTLFALHVPIDILSRIWDVYAFEGDPLIIRTAIAVLTVLEGRLYGTREEVISILGWEGGGSVKGRLNEVERDWRLGHEDDFMIKIRSAGKEEV